MRFNNENMLFGKEVQKNLCFSVGKYQIVFLFSKGAFRKLVLGIFINKTTFVDFKNNFWRTKTPMGFDLQDSMWGSVGQTIGSLPSEHFYKFWQQN